MLFGACAFISHINIEWLFLNEYSVRNFLTHNYIFLLFILSLTRTNKHMCAYTYTERWSIVFAVENGLGEQSSNFWAEQFSFHLMTFQKTCNHLISPSSRLDCRTDYILGRLT